MPALPEAAQVSVEIVRGTRWAVKMHAPFSPTGFFMTVGITYQKRTDTKCAGVFINLLVCQIAIYTSKPGTRIK